MIFDRLRASIRTLARTLTLRPPSAELPPPANIHPFDLVHDVDTSGLIWGQDLASGHRNDAWITAYYAIAPSLFNAVLDRLSPSLNDQWSRFSFLDLGCGKGRALLLAARRPFHSIIGVELHPTLARIAEQNLRTVTRPTHLAAADLRCSRITVLAADATTLDYPQTPLLVYLYHPFLAPVLRRCLFNLERSLRDHPREAWLLYINPESARVLDDFPAFVPQWNETFPMDTEDLLTDRNSHPEEQVIAYLYKPPTARPIG